MSRVGERLGPVSLRRAAADDVPVLASLYRQCGQVLGPQIYTPAQVAVWSAFADDREGFARYVLDPETWLAEGPAGEVWGFSGWMMQPAPEAGVSQATAEIRSLYVHPSMGRRGLGRWLLGHVLQRARSQGARHFAAWATPFSRPLFAAAGLPLQQAVSAPFNGELFERYRMAGPGPATADAG